MYQSTHYNERGFEIHLMILLQYCMSTYCARVHRLISPKKHNIAADELASKNLTNVNVTGFMETVPNRTLEVTR